jgi:hypothetical protein
MIVFTVAADILHDVLVRHGMQLTTELITNSLSHSLTLSLL